MKSFRQYILEAEFGDLVPQSGTQLGSNPGGIAHDANHNKHYVKQYRNHDQAKTEALTGALYNHLQIKTTNPIYRGNGVVSSQWNDKLKQMHPSHFEKLDDHQKHQLGRMYHAAVLTKNWDIAGLEHDNIVKNHETGDLHSVDQGGAFHFRAQGGPKDYGSDIGEHQSLKNPSHAAGHVFGHNLTPEIERKSLDTIRSMDHEHVHGLFKNSGLSNWKELHTNFMARRQKLLDHYDR